MIVACDPGLRGAFAMFVGEGPESLTIYDMPTYTAAAGARGKDRAKIDEHRVFALLAGCSLMGASRLVIEQVNGVAGQSAAAAFTFGYGVGIIIGAAIANNLAIERVPASVWKLSMQAPKDKRAARARASELLPHSASKWPLVGHDGRAEAALIALYAERHL